MSVDLFPTWVVGSVDLTEYPYSVDRDNTVDVGEPEMIVEGIASNLADGDLERTVRHGNRVYVIPLYIEGPTLLDVAEAEARLRAEIRRNGLELTHDPGDGFAPASMYEVHTAQLTPTRDDTHESHLIRKFTLTLTCGPWARSADLTTVEALAPPPLTPVTATITNADTTTGFTATKNASTTGPIVSTPITVTDQGAYAQATATDNAAIFTVTMKYTTTAVSLTATPYVVVEASGSGSPSFGMTINGVRASYTPVLTRATTGGVTQYVLDSGGGALTEVFINSPLLMSGGTLTVNVHDISRTDTLPQVSARQIARTINVGGTERTPASIKISAPDGTTSLGLTVAYTTPATATGNSPDMRRWRTQGNTVTTDTATFSGKREPIHPLSFEAQVPTSSLPEGGYQMVAMLRSSATGPVVIDYSTGTVPPDSGGVREGLFTGTTTVNFTAANTWQMVEIGDPLSLPTVRTAAGLVQIGLLRHTGETATIDLDEVWLFRVDDDCQLTIVDSSAPFLWLDSPTVDQPVPTVWMGSSYAARRHPGARLKAQGNHHLSPEGTTLFIASRNVDNPKGEATYYRRWHSNAAE